MTERPNETAAADGPRVLRAADTDGRVEPLYPATRLLRANAQGAEGILAAARDEAELIRAASRKAEAEAQERAAALLTEAQELAERVRQEAAAGARSEALDEMKGLLRSMDAKIVELQDRFATEVQETAFRFARAVLDVEFEVKPERVVDLVARALKRASRYDQVHVTVHTSEVPFLTQAQAALENDLHCKIQISGEEALARSSARIDTDMGSFWAGVSDQLRPLREHLKLPPEEDNP